MAKIVNPKFKIQVKEKVERYLSTAHVPIEPLTTQHNIHAQWYIHYLDSKNLKCKVINLGAGVKKIIHIDNICPRCKGKGVI